METYGLACILDVELFPTKNGFTPVKSFLVGLAGDACYLNFFKNSLCYLAFFLLNFFFF